MSETRSPAVEPATSRAQYSASHFTANRRVDLDEVLAILVHERLLSEDDARRVRSTGRSTGRSEVHPLVVVANAKLEVPGHPGKPLSLEYLTEWLARHAEL